LPYRYAIENLLFVPGDIAYLVAFFHVGAVFSVKKELAFIIMTQSLWAWSEFKGFAI
jgi:hypothetical protein